MHDIKYIRENGEAFDAAMARRGLEAQSFEILQLDEARRDVQTKLQELQATRNAESKKIGQLKAAGEDASAVMQAVADIKDEMGTLEEEERSLANSLNQRLAGLPNILADDVPDGADEDDNVEVRTWSPDGVAPPLAPPQAGGEKTASDSAQNSGGDVSPVPEHFEIGEALGMMDFERAAKMSGARFVLLSGGLARLERALAQFFLDTHVNEHGYTEVSPPVLVKDDAMYWSDKLPKFADDSFQTTNGYWLIPTSEVSLASMVGEEIVEEASLPRRYTAFTPCFRSEAGSAGKDTRGMIRQHQFYKVEMVGVTKPEDSEAEQKRMVDCAQTVLEKLELPYRTVVLCSGDTGFGARRTFDIEVWLPGQQRYREISSVSTCGDFQARRMNARFKRDPSSPAATTRQGPKNEFVHTLNGSGVAVGRALIAVIENYYDPADGGIHVPEVLKPYMGGVEKVV